MTLPKNKEELSQSVTNRFWPKVDKTDGCWLWNAGLSVKGYGVIGAKGRYIYAHRYSWLLRNGEIPGGKFILHKCDVPACVNPDHLFVGDAFDNMQDMSKKGRGFHIGYAAKTTCKRGHEFTQENTRIEIRYGKPNRHCRTCARMLKGVKNENG